MIRSEYPDCYVAVDLETTGLQSTSDRILEIGAVKIENGQVRDRFCTLVNPRVRIPDQIQALTGITPDMVEGAPYVEQAFVDFLEFCGDLDLMGHNLLFDYSFLRQQAANQKILFEKRGIDTLRIARALLPQLESRSLTSLCGYFQIVCEHAHRAFHDALAAHMIYEKMAQMAEEDKQGLFLPVPLNCPVKKQSPITNSQKAYLKDLIKYHKISLDVEIDALTKNEASRRIDQILTEYGRIKR